MSPDNNRDKKALESWFDDFSATLKAGDPEQLTSLHTDDAIKMPPREPTVIGEKQYSNGKQMHAMRARLAHSIKNGVIIHVVFNERRGRNSRR